MSAHRYRVAEGEQIAVLNGDASYVSRAAFSPDVCVALTLIWRLIGANTHNPTAAAA